MGTNQRVTAERGAAHRFNEELPSFQLLAQHLHLLFITSGFELHSVDQSLSKLSAYDSPIVASGASHTHTTPTKIEKTHSRKCRAKAGSISSPPRAPRRDSSPTTSTLRASPHSPSSVSAGQRAYMGSLAGERPPNCLDACQRCLM